MYAKTVAALGMGCVVWLAMCVTAPAQPSMLDARIEQSRARVDRITSDLLQLDQHMERNINELVQLLSGVRDSTDTGTKIVRAKEDILLKLKARADEYQRQRQLITGAPNSPWQKTPTAGEQERLEVLDEQKERRIEQIVQLTSSLTMHEDFQRTITVPRSQGRTTRRTANPYHRSNQRVTGVSEPIRESVVDAGTESVEALDRRADELNRQIRAARTDAQRGALEEELASVEERLSTRRSQVETVSSTYPPDTRPVSDRQADDVLEFVDDEVRQIQEDFRRFQHLKSDLDHEKSRLRSLEAQARASGGA